MPLARNSFNSQSLISHLTNSNGCGNLYFKVLLTVSPFRPFFPPQPGVYSRNRRLLPSYAPYASRMDLRDAPRNVNIPPIFSRLRILPVATGVYCNPFHFSCLALTSVSPCLCLPRPGWAGKPNVLSSLPPLCSSLRSFSHSLSLFSTTCSLFLQNAGGGGYPDPVFGLSAGVDEDLPMPETQLRDTRGGVPAPGGCSETVNL